MMSRDEIQGLCALHCQLAAMDGHPMDKKAMRYVSMADYVCHCKACGAPEMEVKHDLIWEAVSTAIVGDPMCIPGTPFNRTPWLWMEATP